jgi:hypothetical protein
VTTVIFSLWVLVYLPCFVFHALGPFRPRYSAQKVGRSLFAIGLIISILVFPAKSTGAYPSQSFPPAHELFAPLQADPSELHFRFSVGAPVAHRTIARIDVGDYLGIYRWALGDAGALQLNVGGSINTRFDATTTSHDLQVVDFYGNVPVDLRIGQFSARSMFYHVSSHLGDDYLRENNIESVKHSWDSLREILSWDLCRALRLYGGYSYAIHTKPEWGGRDQVQGGAEMAFNPSGRGYCHPYWANDVQSWARSGWDPTWTSQLGAKTGDPSSLGRGVSYFIEYMNGPRPEGQFFGNRETIWTAGVKFQISDR